jgi:hypothetical protein
MRNPSQQKQHRDFHQTEKKLTTRRSGDIARSRKKISYALGEALV